jgi:hypothetical protein
MLLSVICFVDDLGPDRSALLAAALERAGTTAALRQPAAGRDVVLCRFSAAAGLETLYAPGEPPYDGLDLRRFALAARAAAETRAGSSSAGGALAALDALLNDETSAWLSWLAEAGGMLRCTFLSAAPTCAVDETALEAGLQAASDRFWQVQFVAVAPPAGAADLDVQQELLHTCAALSFASAVAASDNGGYRALACTPAAAEELALTLLMPEEPAVHAVLCLPAQLVAGGSSRLRVALRAAVMPLRDRMELVRVCNCHGRPLQSSEALISDAPFVKVRENGCAVSGKLLKAVDIHPNGVVVGDGVLRLPSFLQLPWLTVDGEAAAEYTALSCVPLASISESQLFGMPFTAHALDDEEEQTPTNASNAALVEAVRTALHGRDSGLLLAGTPNLETGAHAMFRCLYIAMPSAEPYGGLMLKRVTAREELMPTPATGRAPDVPPALAAEVARSLAAMLPATPFDAWAHERGMHAMMSQAVDKSQALPPRGAMHIAEADAMEARERASGRKPSSKK